MNSKMLIKIGGSLFRQPESVIRSVAETVISLSKRYQIFLIMGSGPLGECYKEICKKVGLNDWDDIDVWPNIRMINILLFRQIIHDVSHNVVMKTQIILDSAVPDGDTNIAFVIPELRFLDSSWSSFLKDLYGVVTIPNFPKRNYYKCDVSAPLYCDYYGVSNMIILKTEIETLYANVKIRRTGTKCNSISFDQLMELEKELENSIEKPYLDKGLAFYLEYRKCNTPVDISVTSYKKFTSLNFNEIAESDFVDLFIDQNSAIWLTKNTNMQ